MARAAEDGSGGLALLHALRSALAEAFGAHEAEPEAAAAGQWEDERLSRYLTRVLRHDAKRLGLQMRSDGSVELEVMASIGLSGLPGAVVAAVLQEERLRRVPSACD